MRRPEALPRPRMECCGGVGVGVDEAGGEEGGGVEGGEGEVSWEIEGA